ncbi:unnamed protein product [Gongylonema pulchrum]|uniref:Uncharacterized protein n=1 Tax=Gongylonema pulchrum TaxID=637853 RepID=A0A183E3R2_9BILA|nr:unnamed protein product [Gongylonema pulchrum]
MQMQTTPSVYNIILPLYIIVLKSGDAFSLYNPNTKEEEEKGHRSNSSSTDFHPERREGKGKGSTEHQQQQQRIEVMQQR